MKLQREEPGPVERKENSFRRYAPFAAGIALVGMMASTPIALGQPKEQCSASVQSGSIPAYYSKGKKAHTVSTPLMREGKYLSLSIPNRHMDKVVKAAKARPEEQRASFVRDAVHSAIQSALTRLGKGERAAFDCPPPSSSGAAAPAEAPAEAAKKPNAGAAKTPDPAASGERRRTIKPSP